MGMFIEIKKNTENNDEAFYSFSTPEGDFGKVSIDKKTAECFVIEEPAWDKESELAMRVFRILVRHWMKGEFPEITCWAS